MSRQVLLLPGMLCDERVWAPQLAALEGAGFATQVPRYAVLDSIAKLAAGVLADAPARFALIGHSLGGVVAFEVLRQAPERVTRLALLDTNPAPADRRRERKRVEQAQRALAGEFRQVVEQELVPGYLSGTQSVEASLQERLVDMALAAGAETFHAQVMALLGRADSGPLLSAIGCPSLVLCGAEDRLCPAALHEAMATQIPGAQLCIVPGAGHFPGLEQPAATNAALLDLLSD